MMVNRYLPNQHRLASFRRGLFPVLLAFLPLLVISTAAYASPGIPEVIWSANTSGYLWFTADSAVNDEGTIDPDLFESIRITLRSRARAQAVTGFPQKVAFQGDIEDESCAPSSNSTTSWDPRGYYEPERLFKDARFVFSGVVAESAQGFSDTTDGTLLRIQVSKVINEDDGSPIEKSVLVFYPYSRFSLAGIDFCKGRRLKAVVPTVGDTVIVAAAENFFHGINGNVLWVKSAEVVVINPSNGKISWPPGFCSTEHRSDTRFSEIQMELCPIRYTNEAAILSKIVENLGKTTIDVNEKD